MSRQFDSKLIGWINNYTPVVFSPEKQTYNWVVAMREFVKNIYPIATPKAKSWEYWDKIESSVNIMDYTPEMFIPSFKIFFELLRVSIYDLIE